MNLKIKRYLLTTLWNHWKTATWFMWATN